MRYWFDTEFIENGVTIDLISLGMVAEDGRELYVQNIEAHLYRASDWVQENVIPHLEDKIKDSPNSLLYNSPRTVYHQEAAKQVRDFCDPEKYGKPEFWGYYADYDWVALCQLFGTMMDLPKGWPMYCLDIKQLCVMVGDPKLPEQGKGEHHALADAKWNKLAYEYCLEVKALLSESHDALVLRSVGH